MVACLVNLEATGNQGLVASRKFELCCKSVMPYHFLVNLLKTTEMTRYCMDQEETPTSKKVTQQSSISMASTYGP
jgi:hypothetical protein